MNNKQKLVLILGAVALVCTILYPPWVYTERLGVAVGMGQQVEPLREPKGYGFITKPPVDLQPGIGLTAANAWDWQRLLLEWAILAAIVGAIYYAMGKKSAPATRTETAADVAVNAPSEPIGSELERKGEAEES